MYKFRVTNLYLSKELSIALKSIYGIGFYKANLITALLGISSPFFLDSLIYIIKIYYFFT